MSPESSGQGRCKEVEVAGLMHRTMWLCVRNRWCEGIASFYHWTSTWLAWWCWDRCWPGRRPWNYCCAIWAQTLWWVGGRSWHWRWFRGSRLRWSMCWRECAISLCINYLRGCCWGCWGVKDETLGAGIVERDIWLVSCGMVVNSFPFDTYFSGLWTWGQCVWLAGGLGVGLWWLGVWCARGRRWYLEVWRVRACFMNSCCSNLLDTGGTSSQSRACWQGIVGGSLWQCRRGSLSGGMW